MVDYLKDPPPFGANKGLPEYDLIEIMEFALPREWQKQMPAKGYKATVKYIYTLAEFC